MLKKLGIRKIVVTTSALFVIGLLYLFPNESQIEINKEINYIDEEDITEVFLLDTNNYVSEVSVPISEKDTIETLKNKLTLITKTNDKNDKIPSNFKAIIPENTKINSITIEEGKCTVDFSKEILGINALLEEKMIEAIVFTLTSVEEVEKVIIKVDGNILERLPNSNKLLPNEFDREYGINKNYDINNLYNLTKTTVYYVGDNDGEVYYVPVTKVTNCCEEKISIIVSELKSSVLYQSNLGSYLNNKAELKKYELDSEVMKLSFNDKIFDSMYDKNILEEVVYTIGKSVKDSYDVDKVIFYVDDNEIVSY